MQKMYDAIVSFLALMEGLSLEHEAELDAVPEEILQEMGRAFALLENIIGDMENDGVV